MHSLKALAIAVAEYGVKGRLITTANTKVEKNIKDGFYTGVVHLLPDYDIERVCPFAGLCSKLCLTNAGNPAYLAGKLKARYARTALCFENRQLFLFYLAIDIARHCIDAAKLGLNPAIRPNGTSDIPFESKAYRLLVTAAMMPLLARYGVNAEIGKAYTIFELFPEVQFYDYTKIYARLGREPENYHLTFSLDGQNNVNSAELALRRGYSVAIPFYTLPDSVELNGRIYSVFDADKTDFRPLDPRGQIAGLKYKRNAGGKANNVNNGFIIEGRIIRQSDIIAAA
jgi:hypothetical protein